MLSYALAIAVAISSLVLFSTAFLMSKIHRRDDFLWSGVGLFYALILWYCAKNITGAVLLGQAAATALLVSYSWQTIKLRQMVANPAKAAAANSFSVVNTAKGLWKRKKPGKEVPAAPEAKAPMPTVTEEEIAIPETPVEIPTKTPDPADASIPSKDSASDSTASKSTKDEPIQDKIEDSAKNVQTVAKAATPDTSSIQFVDRPTSLTVEAPSVAPLPNKLPESADSVTKPAAAESALEEIDIPPSETANNISPQPVSVDTETKTDSISSETAMPTTSSAIADQVADNVADSEVAPAPEIAAPEIAKPASPLDSLETVEVAEVLEAEADSSSTFSESNQANIIEVTTTDIDADTETKK
ncbi:MAG: Ycf66 family protein [Cyanobacteria bacterium J06631_2]